MFNDNSPMPFGKYKGTAMANVPAKYLIWLHEQGCNHPDVKQYILVNMDCLLKEVSKINRYVQPKIFWRP
jgi:uncharacterized protein (DUF3820 family)